MDTIGAPREAQKSIIWDDPALPPKKTNYKLLNFLFVLDINRYQKLNISIQRSKVVHKYV
ncbi:hypothetical protein WALSEDRAFT_59358 [Wallemia mellicola CBS 633.66]|uniref:Uncharacterized protein n=1 Tax=Wallemia mellicola (strain ATCC MYA-4683 / CBS 633.66) TaxID=671144 RepID=I4YIC6_WALMC|nr:hypothetical protein WALSEDRAFT_59358 [Wallemia mellicola CBS 633.66]EIM23718.1 hypothetical protein WALSEDRAFT_59358 [Wallemia mellicola CBS 633.66]|eukprot:XP_006956383.1 hypothetical protein WALSEDRAFT_59358 [Wallemia mellicola CBS 633.66]